mgnify:CR=1 FL=1
MVTEKLEKSYDLWEKTETFGVEQRVRLYCMFIFGTAIGVGGLITGVVADIMGGMNSEEL